MELIVCQDEGEVALRVRDELSRLIPSEGRLTCFMPTGATPKPLFQLLRSSASSWSRHLEVYQIDEWVCGNTTGAFQHELRTQLVDPLHLQKHFHPVPTDKSFFEAMAKELETHPPQLAVIGLGPNGHVGFHEPHLPADFSSGILELGAATKEHLQKYCANLKIEGLDPAQKVTAFSFGAGMFNRCEKLFMIVTGAGKAEILKRFLNSSPDPKLPATLLKNHPNFKIFVDKKAYQNK